MRLWFDWRGEGGRGKESALGLRSEVAVGLQCLGAGLGVDDIMIGIVPQIAGNYRDSYSND